MTDDFLTFWAAYPKKVAKGDARKAWAQMSRMMPSIESLLTAISAAKETEQWRRDGGAYIPYPATWLRQERWDDEHEVQIDKPLVQHEGKLVSVPKPQIFKAEVAQLTDEQRAENRRKFEEMRANLMGAR